MDFKTKVNYGLLNRTYETDVQFDPRGSKTQWQRFENHVKFLNKNADRNTQYKVLLMARHGEGWHNAAETFYGTPAWNVSSLLEIMRKTHVLTSSVLLGPAGRQRHCGLERPSAHPCRCCGSRQGQHFLGHSDLGAEAAYSRDLLHVAAVALHDHS